MLTLTVSFCNDQKMTSDEPLKLTEHCIIRARVGINNPLLIIYTYIRSLDLEPIYELARTIRSNRMLQGTRGGIVNDTILKSIISSIPLPGSEYYEEICFCLDQFGSLTLC